MEELKNLSLLISGLETKVIAAMVGAIIAGLFSIVNLYLSNERQKTIVKLQKELNDNSSFVEHLRKEISEKHSSYLKESLDALTHIDHLTENVGTRIFKYHGNIKETQDSIEMHASKLWVNTRMLGHSKAISLESTMAVCDQLRKVRSTWACLLSELILGDEIYLADRKSGENPHIRNPKDYSEQDVMRAWKQIRADVHSLSEVVFKEFSSISSKE
ncbi:hypothetical protein PMAN_a1222 [Pseudoalteromonas marina]|uniref:hypothetical protein n=1 Tax=Pseudoalteromonas marina TaxID=267375 RepID=UPI00026D1888|nr:hypothetical protein [Pseudoalteromonas marina]KAF7780224.1 hypothetical protein PMAN_a1222 [Pseudoalteromonas marina]